MNEYVRDILGICLAITVLTVYSWHKDYKHGFTIIDPNNDRVVNSKKVTRAVCGDDFLQYDRPCSGYIFDDLDDHLRCQDMQNYQKLVGCHYSQNWLQKKLIQNFGLQWQ